MLVSQTFGECFIDEDVITTYLVDSIAMSGEACLYILEQMRNHDIDLGPDETPHDTFCGIIKDIIVENINAIKAILNEPLSEDEEEDEEDEEEEDEESDDSKSSITHLENNLNQEDKVLNEGW